MPLRVLIEADLAMVLKWRNHPFVRLSMFSSHEIDESEHLAWFQRVSKDPKIRWYVHEDETGIADGAVNFIEYRPQQGQAFWGFYRNPGATSGSGTLIGIDGLDHAFDQLKLRKLNAEVLANNVRSIRLHERLGFQREGVFREGLLTGSGPVDVIRYGILEREWRQIRGQVLAGMAASTSQSRPKSINTQAAPAEELVTLYEHIRMQDTLCYPFVFLAQEEFQIQFSSVALKDGILEAHARISKRQSAKGAGS